jgi:hypothetical protein
MGFTVTAADKLFVWVTMVPAAEFSAAEREATGGGLGKIFTGVTPPILIPPSVVTDKAEDFGGRRILKFTSEHWKKMLVMQCAKLKLTNKKTLKVIWVPLLLYNVHPPPPSSYSINWNKD